MAKKKKATKKSPAKRREVKLKDPTKDVPDELVRKWARFNAEGRRSVHAKIQSVATDLVPVYGEKGAVTVMTTSLDVWPATALLYLRAIPYLKKVADARIWMALDLNWIFKLGDLQATKRRALIKKVLDHLKSLKAETVPKAAWTSLYAGTTAPDSQETRRKKTKKKTKVKAHTRNGEKPCPNCVEVQAQLDLVVDQLRKAVATAPLTIDILHDHCPQHEELFKILGIKGVRARKRA